MSTTRTYSRTDDDVSFGIMLGVMLGTVSDPDAPLVLATDVEDGECGAVASVEVHEAFLAAQGLGSDEEAEEFVRDSGYQPVKFVRI